MVKKDLGNMFDVVCGNGKLMGSMEIYVKDVKFMVRNREWASRSQKHQIPQMPR